MNIERKATKQRFHPILRLLKLRDIKMLPNGKVCNVYDAVGKLASQIYIPASFSNLHENYRTPGVFVMYIPNHGWSGFHRPEDMSRMLPEAFASLLFK